MFEVTSIDNGKKQFVKGAHVKINENKTDEVVEETEQVNTSIIDIDEKIKEDVQELKSYEKDCGGECCSTAIGHPNAFAAVKTRQRVFDSGLKVLNLHKEKIKIEVPKDIMNICDELQERVGRFEFSIVCKGRWGDDGEYIVDNEYVIPKQKVDAAAVDYDHEHLEELKSQGFNVVIHSHPFKSSSFSSSDNETINSHFDCSILYSMREFTTATVLISHQNGIKLLAVGDPYLEGEDIVPKVQFDNIEKKHQSYLGNYPSNLYNGDFGDFRGAGRNNNPKGFHGNTVHFEKGVSARSKVTIGAESYTYDPKTDTFFQDGKVVPNPIDHIASRRGSSCGHQGHGHCGGNQGHGVEPMVRVHLGTANQLPKRVFTTDSKTEIFNSGDGKKSKGKGKGKVENLPKVEL